MKHGISAYTHQKCRCEVCREAKSAYQREYYQKNKEAKSAYQREYYQKNKEAMSAYQREYRQKNKEAKSAYQREYYQKKREKRPDCVCPGCRKGDCNLCDGDPCRCPCFDLDRKRIPVRRPS